MVRAFVFLTGETVPLKAGNIYTKRENACTFIEAAKKELRLFTDSGEEMHSVVNVYSKRKSSDTG